MFVKLLYRGGVVLLLGGSGLLGYRLTASHMAADIYRDRIQQLSSDYESLRTMYNQAIRKTAVTELIVDEGRLTLSVPTPDGGRRNIETGFDPSNEIYCDYVQIDGRLWIRRLYDDRTAPSEGLLLDTRFEFVDWDAPGARQGHAVYRSLAPGRWIVTVTGDGSLGLVPVEGDRPTQLTPAPQVYDYEQIDKQLRARIDRIGPGDVVDHLFGGEAEE